MKEKINEYYHRLYKLEYSEENIAELYSIVGGLISTLEKIDDNRKTNKCLHFIKLTREKEFDVFDTALKQNWEKEFNESKTNLLSDLRHYCFQYWDPLKDKK